MPNSNQPKFKGIISGNLPSSNDIVSTNNKLPKTFDDTVSNSEKTNNQELMTRCVNFLEALPAEENHITKIWESLGLTIKTAFDSQASIELYNDFCTQKRCLHCNVGIEVLKK
jgi:hypothetical protein